MRRIFLSIALLAIAAPEVRAQATEALLDTVQHASFNYFWEQANPSNGMVRDRSTLTSPCSIAAVGFGLSAICIGIDHGWITRADGRARVRTTLETFWNMPQSSLDGYIGYKGLFYHFLDMNTGVRTWSSELSTIDTALLFAGMIHAREYFSGPDTNEVRIRALADSIYRRADWKFMQNFNPGVLMGWKPGTGFSGFGQWIGYNEAMILYILALGSPTHPVATTAWSTWTSGYQWNTLYGQTYVTFPPLFGHQYSHCWIDFRYIQDAYMQSKGITYYENSRRATLAQQAYCIANPGGFAAYGDSLWGLTASDVPSGYNARGAPPPQNDDGTITPSAVGGSLPFAPEIAIPALRNMRNAYPSLWGLYGYRDAFNPTVNWYDTDYLGIDEGPIVIMIENYRTRRVWDLVRKNAAIQLGLSRAGFVTTTAVDAPEAEEQVLLDSDPNPFRESTALSFRLPAPAHVRLSLYDVAGREVRRLAEGFETGGLHRVTLEGRGLRAGIYFYRLDTGGRSYVRRCALIR